MIDHAFYTHLLVAILEKFVILKSLWILDMSDGVWIIIAWVIPSKDNNSLHVSKSVVYSFVPHTYGCMILWSCLLDRPNDEDPI